MDTPGVRRSLRRTVPDSYPQDFSEDSDGSVAPASAPSQVLVEDSQQFSPGKFKTKTDAFVEESQQYSPSKVKSSKSVKETPVKLDFAGAFDSATMGGSKNLFSQDVSSICETDLSQTQLPQHAERPELSTPTKRPPVKDVASPTSPVVKLYKLSQEDIIRLSPSKQATNDGVSGSGIGSPPRSVGRGVKRRASLLKVSRAASQEKKSEDGKVGKQVNMDDIIPSSQDALAFAIDNSHCVAETQFTPKLLGLDKDQGENTSLSFGQSEKSKTDVESTLKDTSDMEITVIEKENVANKEGEVESSLKEVDSNHDNDKSLFKLKSGI